MKPKPFVALNHFTVPIVILCLQDAQMRDTPARPSRELDPISAMSWGVGPVRRDQQGKSTIRMPCAYAFALPKASKTDNMTKRQTKPRDSRRSDNDEVPTIRL